MSVFKLRKCHRLLDWLIDLYFTENMGMSYSRESYLLAEEVDKLLHWFIARSKLWWDRWMYDQTSISVDVKWIGRDMHVFQHVVFILFYYSATMGQIDEQHRDEDGFLYVACSCENTFGQWPIVILRFTCHSACSATVDSGNRLSSPVLILNVCFICFEIEFKYNVTLSVRF